MEEYVFRIWKSSEPLQKTECNINSILNPKQYLCKNFEKKIMSLIEVGTVAFDAIETPFQTFDGLWTLIFAGQEDYMDTTREFTWTPEGYALNSSSGKLVPVEAPDTSNVKSIYSVVHSLSWEFERLFKSKSFEGKSAFV